MAVVDSMQHQIIEDERKDSCCVGQAPDFPCGRATKPFFYTVSLTPYRDTSVQTFANHIEACESNFLDTVHSLFLLVIHS